MLFRSQFHTYARVGGRTPPLSCVYGGISPLMLPNPKALALPRVSSRWSRTRTSYCAYTRGLGTAIIWTRILQDCSVIYAVTCADGWFSSTKVHSVNTIRIWIFRPPTCVISRTTVIPLGTNVNFFLDARHYFVTCSHPAPGAGIQQPSQTSPNFTSDNRLVDHLPRSTHSWTYFGTRRD